MTHDIGVLTRWIQACMIIAAFFTTAFPFLYAFFPWRSTRLGRVLMLQGIAFATVLDMTVLFQFWEPSNVFVIFWVEALGFAFIACTTGWFSWLMVLANRKRRRNDELISLNLKENGMTEYEPKHSTDSGSESNGHLLNNTAYDVVKYLAMIVFPAIGTLYFAIAGIWHLPDADQVVGTVVAVDTFLGVVLRISSTQYNNSDSRFDGSIDVVDAGDGTGMINLHPATHPAEFVGKKQVTFKVNPDQLPGSV